MAIIREHDWDYRYRVITELVEVDGGTIIGEIKEFKTLKGAQTYAEGHARSMVQTGRLIWLNAEEEAAEIARIERGEEMPR